MEPLECFEVLLETPMNAHRYVISGFTGYLLVLVFLLPAKPAFGTRLKSETLRAWDRYVELTEKRRNAELDSKRGFLVGDFLPSSARNELREKVRSGGVYSRKMVTLDEERKEIDIPSGMIHHWYGAIFVPGVKLADVLSWVQNYSYSHRHYDEVESSRLLSRDGDVFRIFLRLKRTKVITVHYNTEHEVVYTSHGEGRASSRSYSTKLAEIEAADGPREREKPQGNDSGFLWRLNSYWRFQQQGGGVMVDCETVSLSRSIPKAMEWMIKSYLESVPRESLEQTLVPIRRELKK
jgi:hypothetical protein